MNKKKEAVIFPKVLPTLVLTTIFYLLGYLNKLGYIKKNRTELNISQFCKNYDLPPFLLSKIKFQKFILLILLIQLLKNYVCCLVSRLLHKRIYIFL